MKLPVTVMITFEVESDKALDELTLDLQDVLVKDGPEEIMNEFVNKLAEHLTRHNITLNDDVNVEIECYPNRNDGKDRKMN